MILHEECGVFGIFGWENDKAAYAVHDGLFALQHRGQESCGIAVNDGGQITAHKDMGLVGEVFNRDLLDRLGGKTAIGHVRYSTTGDSRRENAQPLVTRYAKGLLALAHNGNLTNTNALHEKLAQRGAIFQTSSDSEIIAYLIAASRYQTQHVEDAVNLTMRQLRGAFSLLLMSRGKLIAARDPLGFRPLCLGRVGQATVVASESCALDAVGATFIRDIKPGEIFVVDRHGQRSIETHCRDLSQKCVFEYIYFARPDSVIDKISVHEARLAAGRLLYEQSPVPADVVIGVPESGIDAAIGYSQASQVPYGKGFVRNAYIGRSFIQPSQEKRETAVSLKLSPIRSSVAGKNVVLIDDSIVRGTTSRNIIRQLKQAGAGQVHLRISAPPFLYPCYYGTDIPSSDQLIARQMSHAEMAAKIGADSLDFLKVDNLSRMLGEKATRFCSACFTGKDPQKDLGGDDG